MGVVPGLDVTEKLLSGLGLGAKGSPVDQFAMDSFLSSDKVSTKTGELQKLSVLSKSHRLQRADLLQLGMVLELVVEGFGELDLGQVQRIADAGDAGLGGAGDALHLEGGLDGLAVGLHDHRHAGPV